MTTVIDESFSSSVINASVFSPGAGVHVAGGQLILPASPSTGVSTVQFAAPAVVEVRGLLPRTSISYNHFSITRCGGGVTPSQLDFWSFSSHWENSTAQVQAEYYTPAFQREHIDTSFSALTHHTYRFVLGETTQEMYIDDTLVRTYRFPIARGTSWVFSSGTWYSSSNGEIDWIRVQSPALCGFCRAP